MRRDLFGQYYLVRFHSNRFALDSNATYRIRVSVAGRELGVADIDVVNSAREVAQVDRSNFVPLVKGATLPIKFRIEQGAVSVVCADGGTVTSDDGKVTIQVPPGALESSNVDLGQEFVDLIAFQRGFSASSKIISTSDEMYQELVSLKR